MGLGGIGVIVLGRADDRRAPRIYTEMALGLFSLSRGPEFRTVATRAYNANDGKGAKTIGLSFYPLVQTPSCRCMTGPWSSTPPTQPIRPISGTRPWVVLPWA